MVFSSSISAIDNLKSNLSVRDCISKYYQSSSKYSLHSLNELIFNPSQFSKHQKSPRRQDTEYQSTFQSFYRSPEPFTQNYIIRTPNLNPSFTHTTRKSKLSIELSELVKGFSEQNKKLQKTLHQIQETVQQKEKQRSYKSLSKSKKKQVITVKKLNQSACKSISNNNSTNINSHQKIDNSRGKISFFDLNSSKFIKPKIHASLKSMSEKSQGLKKKNISQLIIEQKDLIKNFGQTMKTIA